MSKIENFQVILNGSYGQIKDCLDEYYDAVNENMPNFPVVDINAFVMHLDETCWSLLDKIVEDDSELSRIRYDWLMKMGKEAIGDDFMDFGNLTKEDKAYLKRTYTYFEEMEFTCDEAYVDYKSSFKDRDGNPIFDEETGEIVNPSEYEFRGQGTVGRKRNAIVVAVFMI